jgi:hypothetical protein
MNATNSSAGEDGERLPIPGGRRRASTTMLNLQRKKTEFFFFFLNIRDLDSLFIPKFSIIFSFCCCCCCC